MIDRSRSQLHFCLRPSTLRAAAFISIGCLLALPALALLCVVVGGFVYVGCLLVMLLLGLAGGLLAIAGGIMLIGGLLGGGSEATGGGAVLGGVGLVGLVMCGQWYTPVCGAGEAALVSCSEAAEFLTIQVFLGHHAYLWACLVLAVVATPSLAVVTTIGILRCEATAKSHLLNIHYTCPSCHQQGPPQFRCPQCSTLVRDLVPSPYGVFFARCAKCHASLPTLDHCGRVALKKVCGKCSADIVHPDTGKLREVHFGLLGAQSSGKSTLMVASLWQLAEQFAPANGLQVEFANKQQKKTLRDAVEGLGSGTPLAKTASATRPQAFNVACHVPAGPGCLIYLYDVAGEDLTNEARMSGHAFHQFLDGLILVIDPFAEALAQPGKFPVMARKVWSHVNPATRDVAAVIEPFLNRLERQLNVPAEGVFPIPIAIVVTKMGVAPKTPWSAIAQRLSKGADLNSCRQGLQEAAAVGEKPSKLIRKFLLALGLANLVSILETRFRKVAYFTTSAVEELPAPNRPSAPSRAVLPLLWLIEQSGALRTSPSARTDTTTAQPRKTQKTTSQADQKCGAPIRV